MLDILKTIIGFILGKSSDLGTANRVVGVVNYAWAIPLLGWLWLHRAETMILQVALQHGGKVETITLLSTTYFGLSVMVSAVFIYVEFNRRAV